MIGSHLKTIARKAPLMLCAAALWAVQPLFAAGQKSNGSTVIVDDLTTGAAGSVGLSGGGVTVDVSLGQVGTLGMQELVSKTTAEAGYFSALVQSPVNVSSTVFITSITFQWSNPGNPAGAQYIVTVSSMSDFSGSTFTAFSFGNSATVIGLRDNTTYFARIFTSYMDGDDAGPLNLSSATTHPELPPGCGAGNNVAKDGSRTYSSIQAAISALNKNLTTDTCVVIRDTATYTERVTVEGFASNGYLLKVMSDPTFVSSRPVLGPNTVATSSAVFTIRNTSVVVQGLEIRPMTAMDHKYGIFASSAQVRISSVSVYTPITTAGIVISSFSSLSYSSVTMTSAHGIQLVGSNSTISNSTATTNVLSAAALSLIAASSNSIIESNFANPADNAVKIESASNYNTISRSSMTSNVSGAGALRLISSSSNTVTQSYMSNPSGIAAYLEFSSYNVISQSTITSNGSQYALYLYYSAWNQFLGSTMSNPSGAAAALSGSGVYNNTIGQSSMISNGGWATLAVGGASSNTITQSYISNSGINATAASLYSGAAYNTISNSSITSGGGFGADLDAVSSITITGTYIRGSGAIRVFGSTGTTLNACQFEASASTGDGLRLTGGNVSLTASLNTIVGGSQGAGVSIDIGAAGSIVLATNTVLSGARYGILISTPVASASIFLTSNTVLVTPPASWSTYGLYFSKVSSAVVRNNGIYWRNAGGGAGNRSYGLYAYNSSQLAIDHNRFSNPGMINAGSVETIFFSATVGSALKFNDFNSTGTSLTDAYQIRLSSFSTGNTVKSNIFLSSWTVSGSSASIVVGTDSQSTFYSDYNDWFSPNGVNTAIWGNYAYSLSSGGWQNATGYDRDSISLNPRWFDPSVGTENFHPRSQAGRWTPGGFVSDTTTSGTLDAAEPSEAFSSEPSPNGARANLGSTGGTAEASKTPDPPGAPSVSASYVSSATIAFSGTTPNADAYRVDATTASDFSGDIYSAVGAASPLSPGSLLTNTTYHFWVAAVWGDYIAYNPTSVSTVTLAALAVQASPTFTSISSYSIASTWLGGTNPIGVTTYTVVLTTSSDYPNSNSGNASTVTINFASVMLAGLSPNTTYSLFVNAVNHAGVQTNYSFLGSTASLAATPSLVANAIAKVNANNVSVKWNSNGNPINVTTYTVVFTTGSLPTLNYSGDVRLSTAPTGATPFATVSGLLDNTTYTAFVRAVNHNSVASPYLTIGSTLTLSATPTQVYIDEVTSNTIVASAYAPTPAFMNLDQGLSATNIAKDGAYGAWRKGNTWTVVSSMITGRYDLTAAAVLGKIYAVGGYNGASILDKNEVYDPAFNTWTSTKPITTPRTEAAAAALDGKIYVVAGKTTGPIPTQAFEAYNPASETWAGLPDITSAKAGLAAAAINKTIYAFGGDFAETDAYDTLTNQWDSKAPITRSYMIAASVSSNVYVIGGSAALTKTEKYDLQANNWVTKAPMPTGRSRMAAAVIGGKIYVLGGTNGSRLNINEEYDPAADTWTARAPMPNARMGLAAAAARGKIYAIGGDDGTGHNRNEEYDPGVSAVFNGLTPNTLYTFKAKSRNAAGTESPESPSFSTYTFAAQPLELAAPFLSIHADSVTFQWGANNNPGSTEYRFQISSSAAFNFPGDQISAWGVMGSSSALGLIPNTLYYLRAKARNTYGTETDYASIGSTRTRAAPPGAAAFSNVSAAGLRANWNANGNPVGTQYVAEISTDNFISLNLASTTVNSFAQFGTGGFGPALLANTTYFLKVKAISADNVSSSFTALGSTSTLANPPTSASLATNVTSISLTWNTNANSTWTLYNAQISTDSFGSVNASSVTFGSTATFAGLTSNATYYLKVQALNSGGTGTSFTSALTTATLVAAPVALAPSGVGSGQITANWGINGNSTHTVYTAQISTYSGFSPSSPNAEVGQSSQTFNNNAIFAGLLSANTYYFRVKAQGFTGETAFVMLPSTITLPQPPGLASPTYTKVEISSVSVQWTANGNGPSTLYVAQVSTDDFATINASSSTLSLSALFGATGEGPALIANTSYYFRVQANNGALGSSVLPLGSTATLAAAPIAAAVSNIDTTTVQVNWGGNGNPMMKTTFTVLVSTGPSPYNNGFSGNLSSNTLYTSLMRPGLTPNTTYYFDVRARNHNGIETSVAALGSTVTWAAAPIASNIVFGESWVSPVWTPNNNPTGTLYVAEISTDNFVTVNLSSTTASNSARFGAGGYGPALAANTLYYLRTKAVNYNGVSSTFTVIGSTFTQAVYPMSPTTSVSVSSAVLVWSPSVNPVGTLYRAQISTDSFATVNNSSQTLSTAAVFVGLLANTSYFLRVEAINGFGLATGFVTAAATATTVALPISQAPSAVAATSLTLNWGGNSNSTNTVYTAQISTYASFSPASGSNEISATTDTLNNSVAFSGLLASTTYYARVQARGYSATTAFVILPSTITTPLPPAVATPRFLATNVSNIVVQWSDGGNGPGTVYVAEIADNAGFSPVLFSSSTANLSANFGTGGAGGALIANTTYFFQVKATNGSLSSGFIQLGSTSTLAAAPVADTPLFTALSSESIRANWTSTNPLGTRYVAVFSTGASPSTNAFAGNASSSTLNSFAVAPVSLIPNTTYFVDVRAINNNDVATAVVPLGSTATLAALPTALPYTAVTGASLQANWSNAGNPLNRTTYTVVLSSGASPSTNGFGGNQLSSVTATSKVFSGLTPNTVYFVEVQALNFNGMATAFASMGSTATLANAPTSPAAVAAGISAITMSWNTNSNPAGTTFLAQVSTDNFSTVSASSQTLSSTATFSGLASNTTYYLQVSAISFSGAATAAVPAPSSATLPAPPIAAAQTAISSYSITANWLGNGNSTNTFYLAQISTDSFNTVNDSSRTLNTSAVFSGLAPGATYAFQVRAEGYSQSTAFVALGSTRTLIPPPGAVVPALANVSEFSLEARWSPGDNGPQTSYAAEISVDNFATVLLTSTTLSTSAVFGGGAFTLTPNTTHYLRVRATNGAAASAFLNIGSTATLATVPTAAAFTNVSSSALTANWTANGNPAGTRYRAVLSSGASPSTNGFAGNLSSTTLSLSSLFSGLTLNVTYYVDVQAINHNGVATAFAVLGSTLTQLTVDVTPPAAVTDLSASASSTTVSAGQVLLTWTSPGDDGAVGTITTGKTAVQYSTFTAGVVYSTQNAQVVTVTANMIPGTKRSQTISGLTPGTTYFFRMWVQDTIGNWSGISNSTAAVAFGATQITGHVMNVSSQGITAVQIDCTASGYSQTVFTVADGSGSFTLNNVPPGVYKLQATWTANGITSSVWQDNIAVGSVNVDFVLNVNYTLSTLTGTLHTLTVSKSGGFSPSRYAPASSIITAQDFAKSHVELYVEGRKAAEVAVAPNGRWTIPNLLPGKYGVRAYNGLEYTEMNTIQLGEGETKDVGFVVNPLPNDKVFAFPNPARRSTTIRFATSLAPLEAQVMIFDIAGNLLREIPGSEMVSSAPGVYHAAWDLNNSRGEGVASGVYLFTVKVRGGSEQQTASVTKKIAVVK